MLTEYEHNIFALAYEIQAFYLVPFMSIYISVYAVDEQGTVYYHDPIEGWRIYEFYRQSSLENHSIARIVNFRFKHSFS